MTLDPTIVPSLMSKVVNHFLDMHSWQKAMLTLSVIVFGTGSAHQMATYFGAAPPTTAPSAVVQNQPPAPSPTMSDRISPWLMKVGASFIAGFVLGFALRIFVRITLTILTVGIVILVLLSRFHVMNIDFTSAETKYQDSIHWLEDQGERFKDTAVAHLPHSSSGVFGAFAGFRRRKLRV